MKSAILPSSATAGRRPWSPTTRASSGTTQAASTGHRCSRTVCTEEGRRVAHRSRVDASRRPRLHPGQCGTADAACAPGRRVHRHRLDAAGSGLPDWHLPADLGATRRAANDRGAGVRSGEGGELSARDGGICIDGRWWFYCCRRSCRWISMLRPTRRMSSLRGSRTAGR